ncbi:MAG: metallophosphatase family protein [Anaerolineales bacterium]|nr:metallophosphatase family protein [Anaerolineales bacterium]
MRVLVFSDVHANLTALEAVLEDSTRRLQPGPPIEAHWYLGDLVGYGPDPNECVERIRSLPNLLCLIGNHDQAALGLLPLSRFNREARLAAEWTREALNEANRAFLQALPSQVVLENFTLAHGSPRQPIWEYILDYHTADMNFDAFHTDFCLVGHSHIPLQFHRNSANTYPESLPVHWDEAIALKPRMIINPGSVGQPRDLDPRAAYALLDTEAPSWESRRAAYDIEAVQRRILGAGLPQRHAERLAIGW